MDDTPSSSRAKKSDKAKEKRARTPYSSQHIRKAIANQQQQQQQQQQKTKTATTSKNFCFCFCFLFGFGWLYNVILLCVVLVDASDLLDSPGANSVWNNI